ncbi:MAG TPA: glycosyltransferase family 4 protein [Phnomibacter sp.]|nr:glycosyltransferase family 4 protein [Phnomibacter sp.]
MPPLRILQCIRQGQVGGGETHLLSLMEHIDKNLFDPLVLSFTDGPMIEALHKLRIPTKIIPTLKPFDVRVWSKINQFVKQEKVELIHAHGTRAASNVLWPAKWNRIPLVYTIHGWSFHKDQSTSVYAFRKMGEQLITKFANVNISVSASNQETGFKELSGFNSEVVNNGIDPVKFDPAPPRPNLRAVLEIPESAMLVLFIARFTEHKQPLLLLRAFAKARQLNQKLHLLMVGEGDQKERGILLSKELGIADSVTFLPFRGDVANLLAAGDIFVLPSLWEGLPIGLLEAMAMEKAVVGTNVDGTREVIEHLHNGLLASGDDMCEAVALSILHYANDVPLMRKMGKQARQSILKNYNVVAMTTAIENIYKKLSNN